MHDDEAARRMLDALADGLRRKHPGAIVEVVADEPEADAILDPAATRPDGQPDYPGGDGP